VTGFLPHLVFFLLLSVPVVVIGAFYSEPEDGPALRSVPKRYLVFVGACGLVAALMLAAEQLFATV
jgi:hypothetical protein